MWIGLGELEIFLVGKRFDGTGINDFLTFLGPMLDGEFGGERFPGTGVCGYQDVLVLENSLDGIFLEITQGIGVVGKFGEVLFFGPNFGTYFDHIILLLVWGLGGVDFGGGISILFFWGGVVVGFIMDVYYRYFYLGIIVVLKLT